MDPIWDEFEAGYSKAFGNYYFAISPRLNSFAASSLPSGTLGPVDTAMIAQFTASLPTITADIASSVANAATYFTPAPSVTARQKFFRISADWAVDSDGDGRFDWQELLLDYNDPFNPDSDGDGTPDQAPIGGGLAGDMPTPADADDPTPLATIEQQTLGVVRVESSWEDEEPTAAVYPSSSLLYLPNLDVEPFLNAATYSALKTAVDGCPNPDDSWWSSSLENFSCENSSYSVPFEEGTGHWKEFSYHRARFRLKLNKPAPTGGYKIPLRLACIYQTVDPATGLVTGIVAPSNPASAVKEILLVCDEDSDQGIPVDVLGEDLGENQRVTYIPIDVWAHHHLGAPVSSGAGTEVCVTREEQFLLDTQNEFCDRLDYYSGPPLEVHWKMRKLKGDGTLGPWETIPASEGVPAPPLKGAFGYTSNWMSGIYQVKATLVPPVGPAVDFPFVRKQDGKSIKNYRGDINSLLVAGQPDYIGICLNPKLKDIRDAAVVWLGATGYSAAANVPIAPPGAVFPQPGLTWYNPPTATDPKCNIFVAHRANSVGATVPYFSRGYSWRGFSSPKFWASCPYAKQDWYSEPEESYDLDMYDWSFLANASYPPTDPRVSINANLTSWEGGPCPGMIVASPRTATSTAHGHVGVMDYDGSWVNAGSVNVNKSLHLLDISTHYKPNCFRSR